MKMLTKTLINRPLAKFGLEIKRLEKASPRTSSMPGWKERLLHAKRLGLWPNVVVDGGAFRGLWARDIAAIFPGSQIVSIEPNPFLQDIIRANTSDVHPPVTVLNLALASTQKKGVSISGATQLQIQARLFWTMYPGSPVQLLKYRLTR